MNAGADHLADVVREMQARERVLVEALRWYQALAEMLQAANGGPADARARGAIQMLAMDGGSMAEDAIGTGDK